MPRRSFHQQRSRTCSGKKCIFVFCFCTFRSGDCIRIVYQQINAKMCSTTQQTTQQHNSYNNNSNSNKNCFFLFRKFLFSLSLSPSLSLSSAHFIYDFSTFHNFIALAMALAFTVHCNALLLVVGHCIFGLHSGSLAIQQDFVFCVGFDLFIVWPLPFCADQLHQCFSPNKSKQMPSI